MNSVRRVLVIGGGFSGMTAAIELRIARRRGGFGRNRSRLALVRRGNQPERGDFQGLPATGHHGRLPRQGLGQLTAPRFTPRTAN